MHLPYERPKIESIDSFWLVRRRYTKFTYKKKLRRWHVKRKQNCAHTPTRTQQEKRETFAHKYCVVMELVHEILCLESHVWHSSQRNVFVSEMIHFIVVAQNRRSRKKNRHKIGGNRAMQNRFDLICCVSNKTMTTTLLYDLHTFVP